jgi:hypothetical protein
MKMIPRALLLTACVLTVQMPGRAYAPGVPQASKPPAATVRQAPPHDVATHATKGVVKTVSATAIVITRGAAGKRTETSFVLTPSTQRVGTVAAGSTVEIRYRTDGKQRIATAVSVEAPPQ